MIHDTRIAIELDWWGKGRARDVASRYVGVTTTMVERVWFIARQQGRLPKKWHRHPGGYDRTPDEAKFAAEFWTISRTAPEGWDDFIRKQFLSPAKARVHGLKEVA